MPARKARLLIVDDDASTLATYRSVLHLAGYEVIGASSGNDALALMHTEGERLQLILVDLRLPDMSGLEVLASAKESSPSVPVAMISAWGNAASERAARQLGAAEFFDKPLFDTDLLDAVNRVLAKDPPSRLHETTREARPVGHAASRWATLVVPITRASADVSTLAAWSRQVNRSVATIKAWCHAAGVHANDTLDFARGLRIVVSCEGCAPDWYNVLDIGVLSRIYG